MKFATQQTLFISVAMFLSIGLAWAISPHTMLAKERGQLNLETVVPKKFGDWRTEDTASQIVNPELQAALNKIYNQTLSRTYINSKGEGIMLSIAYGGDQEDNLQVHFPQGCYRGQGFAVGKVTQHRMTTPYGTIPVSRMVATLGARVEPVTYWIVIGDKTTDTGWSMKKAKLDYALRGVVPDGMLVRVSTITPDAAQAYALEQQFSAAMLEAIPAKERHRFIGSAS